MASSSKSAPEKFLVDSIHGDVHLTEREWKVIDTPAFQRLRGIKQLQMSHLTYPNATHTRFSHSIGTLAIMARVVLLAQGNNRINLSETDAEDLRLAALLHDIGHYPYSHLMEGIEKVILLDEKVKEIEEKKKGDKLPLKLNTGQSYPDHVPLGVKIVTQQEDLINALGGLEKAKKIADIFSRNTVNDRQLSNLISSSLDLDRFDYLQRDSYAVGLPYGKFDINYLLNSLKISPDGTVGVHDRAIPAVEHFLLARYFMHRTVYYHRTTVALEEACRQLLRRVRDKGTYEMPRDGAAVEKMVSSAKLFMFNDAFVDRIVQDATSDSDDTIKNLALCIQSRNPPKLLKEVFVLEEKDREYHAGFTFRDRCYNEIADLANQHSFAVGRFLFCELKPISFEKEPSHYTFKEYQSLPTEEGKKQEREEKDMIQIFVGDSLEPKSLLDIEYSIIKHLAGKLFRIYRLYFVSDRTIPPSKVKELKKAVENWDKHS